VVDGTTSATEWKGLHEVSETVCIILLMVGCKIVIYPYSVAGPESPKEENYLPYMAPDGESFRGINAVRLLSKRKNTPDKVIADGYDMKLSIFEVLVPYFI
jgi:hypothetical protein